MTTPSTIAQIRQLIAAGVPTRTIAELCNVSTNCVRGYRFRMEHPGQKCLSEKQVEAAAESRRKWREAKRKSRGRTLQIRCAVCGLPPRDFDGERRCWCFSDAEMEARKKAARIAWASGVLNRSFNGQIKRAPVDEGTFEMEHERDRMVYA